MKIERFVLTGLVAVVTLTLCLALFGDSLISGVPSFSNVTTQYDNYATVQAGFEGQILSVEDQGQSNDDTPSEERFWVYQGRAIKAVGDTALTTSDTRGAITEVLDYLNVNPLITGTVIIFLIFAVSFGFAAWWRSRRP